MSELVTIVVSAGGASGEMLSLCLDSIERHSKDEETTYNVLVVAPSHQSMIPFAVAKAKGVQTRFVDVEDTDLAGSALHGHVLDAVVPHIDTPYLLTLDADCFPLSNAWLDDLMYMIQDEGASIAGILHPYIPPDDDMPKTGIEYRIRSQLCWNNTHVACQLIGMDTLKRLGVGYSDGDDTGFAITKAAHEAGMKVTGYMPSSCACTGNAANELETNREYCVVYGGCMYHHGGGSREEQDRGTPASEWSSVRAEIIEKGAEFLLQPGGSWHYLFDPGFPVSREIEEPIADAMARRIMGGMMVHLQNNDGLFDK